MKIVLVGCGKIGKAIIASLVNEKHDVVAIDTNPKVVEDVRNTYDIIAYCGNGTNYLDLKDADVERAELFIAVTGSDELNMLACFCAKRMGAKHTVARIRDIENNHENLSFMKEQLELSMVINPERMTAEAIYNLIKTPSATKVERFLNGPLEMIEVFLKDNSPMCGKTLIEVRKDCKIKFLISTVYRDGEIYIPNGNFILQGGDKIGIVASKKDTYKLLQLMGLSNIQLKNVMILGAGTISGYLSNILLADRHNVKVVEIDKQACDDICEQLDGNATVINGDGMSQDLLIEEGINSTDAFISLTGSDENNILISVYAQSKEVPKVITKVNRDELSVIAENIGLTTTITPKRIVADVIVKYARALENTIGSQIESLYSVMNGMAEVLEFKVLDDFDYLNVPIKDMCLSNGVLIAGISRKNHAIIPSGDDVILSGDSVVVIAEGKRVMSLFDIIKR